jgi:hypothetical protein
MNDVIILGQWALMCYAPCHSVCHCHYAFVVADSDGTNHAIVLSVSGTLPDMTAILIWLQSSPILVHIDQEFSLLCVA